MAGFYARSPFVALAERFVGLTIYSHELGFLRKPYRDYLRSTNSAVPAVQSHLTQCLEAVKKFFEYLLSMPESSYICFSVVQWGEAIQAILVLSRLTFLMAAKLGWDSDTTRANIPLVMYLDCLCFRFQQISTTKGNESEKPNNPDMLYVFNKILGSVKKSYERRVNAIRPESLPVDLGNGLGPVRGHCPILDPTLSPYFAVTPEDSTYSSSWDLSTNSDLSHGSSRLVYHDLWATMTCSWAD
ncbi:hypothetical protein BGZ60DRAFT_26753 [Tricladium varicosporioides]|nr:hypothetical protein BGZ60DRAFT_26753 [Hymenoscyphus varicosporioides]